MWCREERYSRGIRQRLHKIAVREGWREKHAIHIDGYADDREISYTMLLASSVFCAAVPGEAPTPQSPEPCHTEPESLCDLKMKERLLLLLLLLQGTASPGVQRRP